jgi:hypothetical protein
MRSLLAAVAKKIVGAIVAGGALRCGRRLLQDRSGAAFLLIAFTFFLVIGMIGVAVEGGTWLMIRRNMQAAADAAAYSAVSAIAAGNQSSSGYFNEALAVAAANGYALPGQANCFPQPGSICVNSPPLPPDRYSAPQYGPTGTSPAVEVLISQPQAATIPQMFGVPSVTIRARAVAAVNGTTGTPAGSDCVLALDPTASGALTLTGTGTSLNLNGCGIAVDSNACGGSASSGDAITTGGSSVIVTNSGVSLSGCAAANISPAPAQFQNPVQDPYANLQPPPTGTCTNEPGGINAAACGVSSSETLTHWLAHPTACGPTGTSAACPNGICILHPGTICNGLDLSSSSSGLTVVLLSGLYVIDGNVNGGTGNNLNALKMSSSNETLEDCSVSPTPAGCPSGDSGGVTIYATADSNQTYGAAGGFTMSGGGGNNPNINLTAPQSTTATAPGYVPGCYGPGVTPPPGQPPCGIALWEGGSDPSNITGSTSSSINGAIYTPTAALTYSGNTSQTSTGCTQIVADTITINGTSNFNGSGCNLGNNGGGGLVFGSPALVE